LPVVESVAAKASSRLADAEPRIAALERLTLHGNPDQKPFVGMARDMAPEIIPNVSSLPLREKTADPERQCEIIAPASGIRIAARVATS
jgi:hypothetical protein